MVLINSFGIFQLILVKINWSLCFTHFFTEPKNEGFAFDVEIESVLFSELKYWIRPVSSLEYSCRGQIFILKHVSVLRPLQAQNSIF